MWRTFPPYAPGMHTPPAHTAQRPARATQRYNHYQPSESIANRTPAGYTETDLLV